jgi:small-conductance mechanosensitive channel
MRTRDLDKSPEPFVLWAQLADYAINYQINAFTTRGSSMPRILSDLHRNIVDVFKENCVQIMTPSYEADPEEPKIPANAWDGQLAKQVK